MPIISQKVVNSHTIRLNNLDDEMNDHIEVYTKGALGENDLELKTCNVRIKDGVLKTNGITTYSGTTIDCDGKTLDDCSITNSTLGAGNTYTGLDTGDIQSTNYSGQTLDAELDTLQSNINAKLSTTGNTGNKFLTTTGAGTIQFSKSISDIVDLNSEQTLTNKTISYSQLTGTPTIPTNNNTLTNGAGYITASSGDTLTNKSLSYSQLTGTPTIPTNNNTLTNGAGFITNASNQYTYSNLGSIPSDLLTEDNTKTVTNKSISGSSNTFSAVPYSALTGTPTIPSNNNTLTNGAGFITASSSDTLTNKSLSYSQLTGTPTIPTNNNTLTNGAGFITNASGQYTYSNLGSIPSDLITESNTKTLTSKTLTSPVLTTPQINDTSLDNKYTIGVSELADDRTITLPLLGANDTFVFKNHAQVLTNKSISGSSNTLSAIPYSALTGTPTIPTNNNTLTNGAGFITASSSDTLTNKSISYSQITSQPTIPTNNNTLTNGAGFITSSSSNSLTNKTFNNDNDTFNKYQTSDGVTHTFELGVNTSDEFKFRKNISNTRTDIFTIDHGTAVMTFDHTPKIGSNNILHATDNISSLTNDSAFITASSSDTLTNKSLSYSQLTGTPTIPTNNNTLTNGAGFITASSSDTLTNKTLTAPVISTITNSSATLTLPTSTGTLALTSQLGSGGGIADDDDITFTGDNKFQGDVEIDENNSGALEFLLNNGALPAQVCKTRLQSVQHGNSSATDCSISLPSIKAGQTADQLVGKDAIQTLTGKSISGSTNTFSAVPYSVLTGTPTIPTNNNTLTNGAGFITLSSAGTLTGKTMEIPNGSYFIFKKADSANTDARIYYDTNDTFKIGNLLVDWISVTDGNAISFSSVPQVSSVNLVTRTSSDTLTNKSISYDQITSTPTITNYATASSNYTGNNAFQGSLEINNYTLGGVCNFSIPASTSGVNSSRKIDFVNTRTSGGGMFEIKEGTSTTMTINDGDVGVGVDPDVTFHVKGPSNSSPFAYFEQPHSGGDFRWYFKNDEFTVQRKSGGSYDDVSMYLNYGGGDVIMPKAQVGTTNDYATLTIETQSTGSFTGYAYTSGGLGSSSSATSTLAQYINGDLGVYGVIRVGSDRRIKENIEDVPDNLALDMVKKIPCRYYEYKDKVERGTKKTIGFIAQEVKEVFDIAVSLGKEFIPNIQKDITHKEWTSDEKGYILKTNDIVGVENTKYKFIVSNSEEGKIEKKCIECKNNGFLFEEQYEFIYCVGTEIDDFHTLHKQKLFALNFSATQELIRKNEALEALVQTLGDRITALENK